MSAWHLLWLEAFLLTQLIETPIYVVALQRNLPDRPLPQLLVLALMASLATHPVLWFVLPALLPSRLAFLTVGELSVCAVEAAYLWAVGVRRPWAWALAANAASLSFGLLRKALL